VTDDKQTTDDGQTDGEMCWNRRNRLRATAILSKKYDMLLRLCICTLVCPIRDLTSKRIDRDTDISMNLLRGRSITGVSVDGRPHTIYLSNFVEQAGFLSNCVSEPQVALRRSRLAKHCARQTALSR